MTRLYLIDVDLRRAGWPLDQPRDREYKVTGMPNVEGIGFRGLSEVTVQFGEPMTFPVVAEPTSDQQLDCSKEVFDQVKRMYTALDEKGRRGVKQALREKVKAPEPGRTIEP